MNYGSSDAKYDPFAQGFAEDPYPYYKTLRETAPVQKSELGIWLLFAYEDVRRFLRDPSVSVEDQHANPTTLRHRAFDVQGHQSFDVRGRNNEQYGGLAMLNRDPPDHTRLRRLVSAAFTPRTIELLAPRIQAHVDAALDRTQLRGGMEVISDLAYPLPFTVISELLGMPDADVPRLRSWSGLIVRSQEPVVDAAALFGMGLAWRSMFRLIGRVVADKRTEPANDLISALIAAEEEGQMLSDDELVQQVALLYIAGHETTVNLIGNGLLALLNHPQQLHQLREEPDRLPAAIEELLRYDSPIQNSRRITLQSIEIGGHEIEKGAYVVLSLASANHDAAKFGADADALDITRPNAKEHLAFGGGHHHCLGAALARLEAQVALGSILQRFRRIETVDDPIWNGRTNFRGLAKLRLVVS